MNRSKKLEKYLNKLIKSKYITQENSNLFKQALTEIMEVLEITEIPDACLGPNGEMGYYWNSDNNSLQVDIQQNGEAEFYYLNRITKEDYYYEYQIGNLRKTINYKLLIHNLQFG